jgi:aromatic ring hydroxylase
MAERHTVDITTDVAFAGMLHELARLYDLQRTPEYRDSIPSVSPDTGNRVSYSYLLPRTMDDLLAKRRNCEIWMAESVGQFPRAPDFMSIVVVGLRDFREHLRGNNPRFGDNAVRYHRYGQEDNLVLTRGLGDPYERWHRGDIVRNRNNLSLRYDRSCIVERIHRLISKPLSP